VKALLNKIAGALKAAIDLDRDGQIEATEVFKIVLTLAPVVSPAALGMVKDRILTIASLGKVVTPDGTAWTREQAVKALDMVIAQADSIIDLADSDTEAVRKFLAAQQAQG